MSLENKKYDFSNEILKIAKIINNNNGKLYLVGGAVRDFLINKENHDEDFCIVGFDKEKVKKLFPSCTERGKSFGVFIIDGKEFVLARTEKKSGEKHTDFNIDINSNITIEEDLKRRDLTINAIAIDVLKNEIIDPYNGIEDLKNKKIKAVSEAFKEDALRVYRVARFSTCLQYNVDNKTLEMMKSVKNELKYLSEERVFEEFRKALNFDKPSIFFEVLKKADVLDIHFKEIYDLIGVEQPIMYHPEGDAYNHTMLALDKCAEMTNKEEIRYSVLVHDLGKGVTPKDEYPHHYMHDKNGVQLVKNLSNRIKVPSLWKKCGEFSASEHMRAGIFDKMKVNKKVELIEKISKSKLGLDGMKIVVLSDKYSSNNVENLKVDFDELGKEMLSEINGKYIKEKYNINEGIQFKEKLHQERIEWLKNK